MNRQAKELFLKQVSAVHDVESLRALADAVAALEDTEIRRDLLASCNKLNPFFVPHATPDPGSISANDWLDTISRARMAAANSISPRIIVSAPMKSGSTFICDSIGQAFGLPQTSLMMLLARPYDYAALGAGPRAHEIDETALLAACLNDKGFVSHHHMLCTPFLANQAKLYNLKFILLKRNIFDCLISLDNFCIANIGRAADRTVPFQRYQVPSGFVDMPQDERIHHLLNRFLHIYVQYFVSWKFYQNCRLIEPLWISYEHELLADKQQLAGRICGWLGRPEQDVSMLVSKLCRDKDLGALQFNRGIAGRGASIQGANRARVVEAFTSFKDIADWSELLA